MFYSDITRLSSIPHSSCTQTEIVAVSGLSKCAQLFAKWDHLQVNKNCDGFVMMIQLVGMAGCVALYEKACPWLHFKVPPPL